MAYLKYYDGFIKQAKPRSERRRDWFNSLNLEAMKVGAFIISSPGATEVIVEVLPGNDWPEALKERGFPIEWSGNGQRVMPFAYEEPMVQNADGTLGVLTLGSTKEISFVKREPGIARTERYAFRAPF
jgi:hypothetical protein